MRISRALLLGLCLAGCSSTAPDPSTPPPPPPPPPPGPSLGVGIAIPQVVEFAEDDTVRTALLALRCPTPSWSLGPSSNADYHPVLSNDTLIHRFAPNRFGYGAVTVDLACGELGGTSAVIAARVLPQPDMTYTMHELIGADHLLEPMLVRVNGRDVQLHPAGGTVQLRQGVTTLALATNPGWRALQVWRVNGMTVPLNLNAQTFNVNIASAEDGGSLTIGVLHTTAHEWYRAGAQSEIDVQRVYWDARPTTLFSGFHGIGGQEPPVYSPINPLIVDGVQVCAAVTEEVRDSYRQAIEAMAAPYAGLPTPFDYFFALSLEDLTPYTSVTGQAITIVNNWSLACDAPVATAATQLYPLNNGQRGNFVTRVPAGGGLAARIAALWWLPRKFGVAVPGSPWVSDNATPGPADLKIAEHFFPIADTAWARAMPPLKF